MYAFISMNSSGRSKELEDWCATSSSKIISLRHEEYIFYFFALDLIKKMALIEVFKNMRKKSSKGDAQNDACCWGKIKKYVHKELFMFMSRPFVR